MRLLSAAAHIMCRSASKTLSQSRCVVEGSTCRRCRPWMCAALRTSLDSRASRRGHLDDRCDPLRAETVTIFFVDGYPALYRINWPGGANGRSASIKSLSTNSSSHRATPHSDALRWQALPPPTRAPSVQLRAAGPSLGETIDVAVARVATVIG
jgi:hypothetical protein